MATSERPTTVIPADHVLGPKQGEWTYDHYAALPDDGQKYEIIDGVLFMTPPSPSPEHQGISTRLVYYLFLHMELPQLGRVFAAPLDVELAYNMVVQPDLVILLNAGLHKIADKRIIGSPDLAIEISSPSTVNYDRLIKRGAYARYGVKEYWIVDPQAHTIELLVLEGDAYKSVGIFSGEQKLPTQVVPDFPVTVKQLFV